MNQAIKNILIDLIIPFCLILLAIFLRPYLSILDDALISALLYAPYALILLSLMISWKFNQVKSLYVAIMLCIIYAASTQITLFNGVSTYSSDIFNFQLIIASIAILFPLNFIIIKLAPINTFFSKVGFLQIILLAGQSYGVYWAMQNQYTPLLDILLFQALPQTLIPTMSLPQIGFLLFSLAALLQVGFIIAKKKPIDSTLLGVLIAVFIACYIPDQAFIFLSAVSAAAMMLIVATIQSSYNMAFVDTLTGLPSRRSLEAELKKLGRNYSIAMLDIDHFKKFNDAYGHDVGDQVLRMVAKHIRRVRGGGRPARYGGEEFAIIFPNRSIIDAAPFLEIVRGNIAQSVFALRDKDRPKDIPTTRTKRKKPSNEVSVTISIGLAEKTRLQKKPEDVLKSADNELYRAKKEGRNRLRYQQ